MKQYAVTIACKNKVLSLRFQTPVPHEVRLVIYAKSRQDAIEWTAAQYKVALSQIRARLIKTPKAGS